MPGLAKPAGTRWARRAAHPTCRTAGGRKGCVGEFWGGLSVLCRCLMAVLLAAWLCGSSLAAQSPDTGSVEGKLTDFYSKPLDGATVVLRNVRTGVEFQVTTGKNGAYRLGGLTQGSYELEARTDSGLGHASGITVMAGRASRVHTAVALGGQSALAARAEQTKWFGAAPGPGREADSATSTIARNPQPVPRSAPTGPFPVRAIAVIPPTPACTSISAGVSPGTIALAHANDRVERRRTARTRSAGAAGRGHLYQPDQVCCSRRQQQPACERRWPSRSKFRVASKLKPPGPSRRRPRSPSRSQPRRSRPCR